MSVPPSLRSTAASTQLCPKSSISFEALGCELEDLGADLERNSNEGALHEDRFTFHFGTPSAKNPDGCLMAEVTRPATGSDVGSTKKTCLRPSLWLAVVHIKPAGVYNL